MNQTAQFSRLAYRRAFTLIEILIVVALTALLFALLIVPLVSAINYTRNVQSLTAAQDATRITRERITRELSSAVFVFDNTSHPFVLPAGTTPGSGDDLSTNFLNLEIPTSTVGTTVVAHAYHAKLDFALPRVNNTGVIDPTTKEPISYAPTASGSAVISSPSQIFPSAAGYSLTRYWVGLKDPSQPYNNNRESKANTSASDNTYILYRAQFPLYNAIDAATGKPKVNADGTSVNEELFVPKHNSSGALINQPELDDPDFFRYIDPAETNPAKIIDWLSDAHGSLTSGQIVAHDTRLDNWRTIAKPVIPGPNIDLILLPHNGDYSLEFDTSGPFTGVAHSGSAHDPITNTDAPVVNASVTFRPGTISSDATPATTSDYLNAAVPITARDSGLTFIPTIYTAAAQSWSQPYHVTLYPAAYSNATPDYTQPYYDTDIAPSTLLDGGGNTLVSAGDVVEYYHSNSSAASVLAYDATNGFPIVQSGASYALGGTNFVPLSVNPDSGTINFAAPSLPNGPKDLVHREWTYTPNPSTAQVDLRNPDDSGNDSDLPGGLPTPSPRAPVNGRVVPGSIRVYGPDDGPGPNHGQRVVYTPVNVYVAAPSDNQYLIDYTTGVITLRPGETAAVQVIYDVQANMTLTDTTKPFSDSNSYLPMQVKVDYQTRDLLDISLGVRIYDVSTGRAQVIPSEMKVKIGNSNR